MAKEPPDDYLLKGSGILKLTDSIRDLEAQLRHSGPKLAMALDALKVYADGGHLSLADPDAWDTVSGEPANFQCDEAGTATVEDGSIAKMALKVIAGENTAYSEMMALELKTEARSHRVTCEHPRLCLVGIGH